MERTASEKFDILFGQSFEVSQSPLLSHMLEQKSHPFEGFRVQGQLALPFGVQKIFPASRDFIRFNESSVVGGEE